MKKLLLILLCLPLLFSTCKKEDEVTPTNTGNNNTGNSNTLTWEKIPFQTNILSGGTGKQTADGGYVIIGVKGGSFETLNDFLMKIDTNGNEQWIKMIDGIGGLAEVQQTADGGYIMTGATVGEDVYLIKTDSNGDFLWDNSFGGSGDDAGNSVQQTSDGGYIIAGGTQSFGNGGWDVYLIKTDANGTEQWTKTFGGIDNDYGMSVQQTADGGYIIGGGPYTMSGMYLIKTDLNGTEQWSQTFGDSNSNGISSQQTTDGGYIIGGDYGNSQSIIKTNENGVQEWIENVAVDENGIEDLQQTSDGGYILVGWSGHLLKVDAYGNQEWLKIFADYESDGYSVQQTTDGGYFICGVNSNNQDNIHNLYLLKTDENGNY